MTGCQSVDRVSITLARTNFSKGVVAVWAWHLTCNQAFSEMRIFGVRSSQPPLFRVKTCMDKQTKISCSFCSQEFFKTTKELKRQQKNGKNSFYCSLECCKKGVSSKRKLYNSMEKSCLFCGEIFLSSNSPRAKKCCSRKCASLYSYSFQNNESRSLRSEKIKQSWEDGRQKYKKRTTKERKCLHCDKEFLTKRDSHVFCSIPCARKHKKSDGLIAYRVDCKFLFSLRDYPEEFDFSLIEKYGWYSASNRGNNLQGISRDHMFSVKDGYVLGVDPKIIAHPANCRLIPHPANISKNHRSTISLDELLMRIKKWDEKYS